MPSIWWDSWEVFPVVKRSGREADQSTPFSGEVKNGGAVSVLHTSSRHYASLIMCRDSVTFLAYFPY
jgi:hypothetical protein